jgi:hypothetical protein
MKALFILTIVFLGLRAFSQDSTTPSPSTDGNDAQKADAINKSQYIKKTLQTWPWRVVDGVTQHVAVTWCVFRGMVVQTLQDGINVQGDFHSIYPENTSVYAGQYVVKHFPYNVYPGYGLPLCLAAVPTRDYIGTFNNAKVALRALDFGIPCDAPAWATNTVTNVARVDLRDEKIKADARVLALNEEQAEAGDPYGLLRMGERYRDGAGVETNLVKARYYLTRAAQTGDITASNELSDLPAK